MQVRLVELVVGGSGKEIWIGGWYWNWRTGIMSHVVGLNLRRHRTGRELSNVVLHTQVMVVESRFRTTRGTVSLCSSSWRVLVAGVLFSVSFFLLFSLLVPHLFVLWREVSPAPSQFSRYVRVGADYVTLFQEKLVVLLAEEYEGVSGPRDPVGVRLTSAFFKQVGRVKRAWRWRWRRYKVLRVAHKVALWLWIRGRLSSEVRSSSSKEIMRLMRLTLRLRLRLVLWNGDEIR